MYTVEMTFKPGEGEEDIGEVSFEIVKNDDDSVGMPTKENWDANLTNDLLNILQRYPNLKKIRFTIDEE